MAADSILEVVLQSASLMQNFKKEL